MIDFQLKTKCTIDYTSNFKSQYKKALRQGKNINKLFEVLVKLANKEPLDSKYKDHNLINDKYYKNCRECHLEPDWLLVYQYQDERLVLLLINIGSHSNIFRGL